MEVPRTPWVGLVLTQQPPCAKPCCVYQLPECSQNAPYSHLQMWNPTCRDLPGSQSWPTPEPSMQPWCVCVASATGHFSHSSR